VDSDLVSIPVLVHRADREIIRDSDIKVSTIVRRALAIGCGYVDDPEIFNRHVNPAGRVPKAEEQEEKTE